MPYTCEPGRWIYRNGVPFFALQRGDTTEPAELDSLAHDAATWLNRREAGAIMKAQALADVAIKPARPVPVHTIGDDDLEIPAYLRR